jgi:predicted ATPase/class 3 adenylate cyclase
MTPQPTGMVTLLFSDIEGSTRLLERLGTERYAELLELHRRLMRDAFVRHEGYEVGTEGDSFFVTFARAEDAVAAAGEAQQALADTAWPEDAAAIRVRMGLHTGEPAATGGNYVGMDVHRAARIMAAARGGQVLVSETTAALASGWSLRDLGPHRLKDLLEPIRLYQLQIDGLAGEFPPLRSLHQTNLPLAAWPLLGREQELAKIRSLVTEGARLLTLTGPGGTGKTRLALQAAGELSDEFADGVFFASLAPLREAATVLGTVAEAVGLRPDDDVVGWLSSKRVLLVLDNLEHLGGVAAVVSELLVGEVVVLATSRAPLHLSGERELPVEPLPDEAAVELFVSRAAASSREIEADETVVAVCRRLDNLPLALELAAARSKLLSPAALLQRLDLALPLLTGGARDLPERQRTLRATIEWSHDLLEADTAAAFRRLSVFRGSFTVDAAEAVTGAGLDQLAALLDQSMLKPLGDERFFMLETLREYARQRLDEAGETDDYALRHARWYLARLEEGESDFTGPRQGDLVAWSAAEEDNLRAMLDRLADAETLGRGTELLSRYWVARGSLREGLERVERALAQEDLPDRSRASLSERISEIEERLGHLDAAEAAAHEAVALAEASGERSVLVDALRCIAWVELGRGKPDDAVRVGHRALETAATVDEQRRLKALGDLGVFLTVAGRTDEARTVLREALHGYEARGDAGNEAVTLFNLGNLDLHDRDYEAAHAAYAAALAKNREVGHRTNSMYALVGLGWSWLGLGREEDARPAVSEALDLTLNAGITGHNLFTETLAVIAFAAIRTDPRLAARLRGAVAHLREQSDYELDPREAELEDFFEQPLVNALGDEVWERERAAGAALTLEETIALARSLVGHGAGEIEPLSA